MDLTLQVRDGAANKEKKRRRKKKEKNRNVSQLLPWLVDKIRAFLAVYTHRQYMLLCGREYLGPKMQNKALRRVMWHWGISSGDGVLGHLWANRCFELRLMDFICLHNFCAFTVTKHQQLCKHTQSHKRYSIRPISLLLLACLQLCRGSHT